MLSTSQLRDVGLENGLCAVGVTDAGILEPARSVLKLRKKKQLQGDMQFTYRNPDRSTDVHAHMSTASSVVAGAYRYSGDSSQPASRLAMTAQIARYASFDAYIELDKGLQAIASRLRKEGYKARVVADSNALVDRNVAWQAGLGWYGKNTNMLLGDIGSWVVLGAVVTNCELEATGPPVQDGCGSCSRCIEDCPTGAIVAPGVLDAKRCIAWLVQSAEPIPIEFREAVGDRIYGCDICQEVCPPNRSVGKQPAENTPSSRRVDVAWLLEASDDEIEAKYASWYIADRNIDVIRRTALVVLGNVGDPTSEQVREILRRYLAHPTIFLQSHAIWAARRLGLDDLLRDVRKTDNETLQQELASDVRRIVA